MSGVGGRAVAAAARRGAPRADQGMAARARAAIVLACCGALVMAGCSTARSPLPIEAGPLPRSPAPAEPTPASSDPGAAARPDGTCRADGRPVRASEPPLWPMPTPGRMPPGSRMGVIARDRGYLRVGIVTDAPPAGLMNWRTLRLEGFDVGIARAVAAAIFGPADVDDHIQFRAVTTSEREDLLRSNMVDMLVATMTITCERKRQVRFSSVYYESTLRLLVRQNAGIADLADLAGRPVCTSAGSTASEKLARVPPPAPRPVTRPRIADCLVALQYGDVDAIVGDDVLLAGLAAQDPYTTVLGPPAFGAAFAAGGQLDEPYGIAMPITGDAVGDDEFVAFVNGVLRQIMSDGTWTRLYDEWLRPGLRVPGRPPLSDLAS
ncbi:Periplasmic component of amino acid ABC-type transporter/signal transduction system [Frankia canadensis]|uniref:Periplasmic component of amino acid ABC-type transporter/signal transduction system n=1 Tax=Frankia canadensis TaxID=1836972 RepID=A0A2I2KJW5_9ACTN|nr:glutamate ABC transporter substrate-binding protein [Frankia canadensis]SNQ45946.1 Periplasmic component of amino acid ABC-type transporter/signal transduction system [Frankia canadensis]SOU53236.1 Periplasmic component of amino acid ABC-type transporter/signal transduction system [Frankia canadensis]